jgi:hypothetical protein
MSVRYSTLALDIKTKLGNIPGTGIVHTYERQAVDLSKFIALFKDPTGKICGWEITRRAVPEQFSGAVMRVHHMVLNGYMGLQDAMATSVTFQDLCDSICDAFRLAEAPPGATWQYRDGSEPSNTAAQVEMIEDRTFGSVLCHHAVISINITERIL